MFNRKIAPKPKQTQTHKYTKEDYAGMIGDINKSLDSVFAFFKGVFSPIQIRIVQISVDLIKKGVLFYYSQNAQSDNPMYKNTIDSGFEELSRRVKYVVDKEQIIENTLKSTQTKIYRQIDYIKEIEKANCQNTHFCEEYDIW